MLPLGFAMKVKPHVATLCAQRSQQISNDSRRSCRPQVERHGRNQCGVIFYGNHRSSHAQGERHARKRRQTQTQSGDTK